MKFPSLSARGQSAVEYLIIFSAVLSLFVAVTFSQMINPSSDAARDSLYLSQARTAADSIAGAINTVYANGPGAVKSSTLQMDKSWTIQLDNIKNVVRVNIETSTGGENLEDNLQYKVIGHHSISKVPAGTYTLIVEWLENENTQENLCVVSLASKKIYIYIRPEGD